MPAPGSTVALGRIKLGPVTTPWIANAVLFLDGERHRLGGPEKARRTEVDERPDGATFTLPGKDITVQGTVGAAREAFVGWVYADPDGSEHHTVNCSVADMTLNVSRPGEGARTLTAAGGGGLRARHAREGPRHGNPALRRRMTESRTARSLGVTFIFAGVMHFLRPRQYEAIMPPYIPAHKEMVAISGAGEIIGGVAALFPRTHGFCRVWLIALLILVFPANVHWAVNPERGEGPARRPALAAVGAAAGSGRSSSRG